MKPYLIVSPDYRHNSGGIKVLHKLCHLLNTSGQKAYISSSITNPMWNTPIAQKLPPDTIVVYPEIIEGNPYKAKHVVRYVLNRPGFIGGDTSYSPNETIFSFDTSFYDVPNTHLLHIPVIERDIFIDKKLPRTIISYWFGNAIRTGVEYTPPDTWIQITRKWPSSREELARIFQQSKYFATYHTLTALIVEAQLCGCPVVVFDDKHLSRDEFARLYGTDGISWGFSDMDHAQQTVSKVSEYYNKIEDKSLEQLQSFISITQAL